MVGAGSNLLLEVAYARAGDCGETLVHLTHCRAIDPGILTDHPDVGQRAALKVHIVDESIGRDAHRTGVVAAENGDCA